MADPNGFDKVVTAVAAANGLTDVDQSLLDKISRINKPNFTEPSTCSVAITPDQVAVRCTALIGGLGNQDKNLALAKIITFTKLCLSNRLKDAKRASLHSEDVLASAEQNSVDLNNILNGNFSTL